MLLAFCASGVEAEEERKPSPIRDAKKFAKRVTAAQRKLVKEHIAAARRHEKAKGEWELWFELKLALRLDPKSSLARRMLPEVPPVEPEVIQPTFQAARGELRTLAYEHYGKVLDRGLRGELPKEVLAPVAQILLRYDPDFGPARSVLEFKGKPGSWLRPSEIATLTR